MAKTIIPQNSSMNNLKTLFQLMSRSGFYDYEKIEFLDSNIIYGLISTPPIKYLMCKSENKIDLSNYGELECIELNRLTDISIVDLVATMNTSSLVLMNLQQEIVISESDDRNITIEALYVKFY